MKPGYRTTEFWLALGTQVLALLVVLGVITPEQQDALGTSWQQIVGAVVMAVNAVGYAISRGLAKRNT